MTPSTTPPASPALGAIHYPPATIQRAQRALRCAPFELALFTAMRWHSVDLRSMIGPSGVQNNYTVQPLSELRAETALLWLIQVGLLRREVDGQGLTDSFRLTPLGHQIVAQWQAEGQMIPAASWNDRVYNALDRWLRLPSWVGLS